MTIIGLAVMDIIALADQQQQAYLMWHCQQVFPARVGRY